MNNMSANPELVPSAATIIAGRVIVVAAACAGIFVLWRTLATGKAWLKGRPEPYRRGDEPIRYWLIAAFLASLAAFAVAVAIITNFTGHYFDH
jgi:hypothetical protein